MSGALPAGLPTAAAMHRRPLAGGEGLDLLVVPMESPAASASMTIDVDATAVTVILRDWLTAAADSRSAVVIPLYDCLVAWAPGRAAIGGPPDRLAALEIAVVEFATREAELREAERRAAVLLEAIDGDLATDESDDGRAREHGPALASRYREAVAIGRRLSLLASAVHAPPVHPPTLASQVGERLRDRTRLVERHELARERGELVERVAEASRQRALELSVARQQMGLEWAIVVLLVVQTAILVVDLLSRRGTP